MLAHSYVKRARPLVPLTPWSLPALCNAYGLPHVNRIGSPKISIIELGGAAAASDMEKFCALTGMPVPTIVSPNSPFPSDPNGADVEVALDQQVAAYLAWRVSGQVPIIEMIWDQSGTIYEGIPHATGDTISISWGAPENEWPPGTTAVMNGAAQAAGEQGMAVFAASGDNDYTDGEPGGSHVDLPAAATYVVACSGTTKTVLNEVCWNNGRNEGTGGGYSTIFPRPAWQPFMPPHIWRSVGDVAANADPATGYEIVVNGETVVVGGTSAVAPFYAGLIAALKAKPGLISSKLYQNHGAFTRITQGNNGKWPASVCDGLGVPNAGIGQVLS